jgi:hypothetical protein
VLSPATAELQAAVRNTVAICEDLSYYYSTGWTPGATAELRDMYGANSLRVRVVERIAGFVTSSPRLRGLGMRNRMTGRIDCRGRHARYQNGSGPWRIARDGEVYTATADGCAEGPPRREPSPLDVLDAIQMMRVNETTQGRALGIPCTVYGGTAYASAENKAPDAWTTNESLTCLVWVDDRPRVREVKITAVSHVLCSPVGTLMSITSIEGTQAA